MMKIGIGVGMGLGGGVKLASPLMIPGLVMWQNESFGTLNAVSPDVAATEGQTIIKWLDSSGNGNALEQATAGRRLRRSTVRKAVTQAAVDSNFVGNVSVNRRNFSAFVICKPLTLNQGPTGADIHNFLHFTSAFFHYNQIVGANYASLGVFDFAMRYSTTKVNTSMSLIGVSSNATNLKFYHNTSSSSISGISAGTETTINVFGTSSSFPLIGVIKDFVLFDHELTPAEVSILQDYANQQGVVFTRTNNIHFEGDSICNGSTTTSLLDWINVSDFAATEYNHSIGGRTAAQVLSQNRSGTLYDAAKNNVLVIFVGTNDIALSGRTGAQVWTDISTFAAARRTQGFKVVLVTMLPRGAGNETQRQSLNNLMRTNWTSCADDIADVETLPMGAAGANTNATWYDADQIHPNNTGHALLSGLIKPKAVALFV